MRKRIIIAKSELVYKVPLSDKVSNTDILNDLTDYEKFIEEKNEKYKLIEDRANIYFIKNGKSREDFIRSHSIDELKEIVTDLSFGDISTSTNKEPINWEKVIMNALQNGEGDKLGYG